MINSVDNALCDAWEALRNGDTFSLAYIEQELHALYTMYYQAQLGRLERIYSSKDIGEMQRMAKAAAESEYLYVTFKDQLDELRARLAQRGHK